ncbi:MAG TPA: Rieske 2Fe-2S domain-containing protein [Candidatus Kapabacteria bacterium]|nr:Rieske 2Fe-2S domain-containing protein [Candidatus Kapabacteria bacterium]
MAKQEKHEEHDPQKFSRRYFLEIIGAGSIGVAAVGSLALTTAYLSPNVVKEPPTKFKVGSPENYPPGSVTFVQDKKLFIVHTKEGAFYTLSATCTHLGCIVNWKAEEGIVACPCHGSKFDRQGNVVHGPAPKPLPHFSITLDDQGLLVVDKSVVVGDDVVLKA